MLEASKLRDEDSSCTSRSLRNWQTVISQRLPPWVQVSRFNACLSFALPAILRKVTRKSCHHNVGVKDSSALGENASGQRHELAMDILLPGPFHAVVKYLWEQNAEPHRGSLPWLGLWRENSHPREERQCAGGLRGRRFTRSFSHMARYLPGSRP